MIYDFLLLIILAVFVIVGFKLGAARALHGFVSSALGFVCAFFLSKLLAELIYASFISGAVNSKVESVLSDAVLSLTEKGEALFAFIPAILNNVFSYFGYTPEWFSQSSAAENASELVSGSFSFIITGVIFIILFIILSFLLIVLIKNLTKPLLKLFKLPLIRIADSLAGAAIGLLEGLFAVFILILLLKLIIPFSGKEMVFLNEEYIASSFVFSKLYFGGVLSIIQNFVFSN